MYMSYWMDLFYEKENFNTNYIKIKIVNVQNRNSNFSNFYLEKMS